MNTKRAERKGIEETVKTITKAGWMDDAYICEIYHKHYILFLNVKCKYGQFREYMVELQVTWKVLVLMLLLKRLIWLEERFSHLFMGQRLRLGSWENVAFKKPLTRNLFHVDWCFTWPPSFDKHILHTLLSVSEYVRQQEDFCTFIYIIKIIIINNILKPLLVTCTLRKKNLVKYEK